MIGVALWVGAASAQEEKCKPLELPAMIEFLDQSELAFEGGNSGEGTRLVDELKGKLRCLTELPTPELMARLASLEALAGHFDQDPDRSVRWSRAAEWVVPGHLWPGAVSADHPLRSLVKEEGPATIGAKGRHGFVVPDDGAIVLSGRLVLDTDVPIDVPLLLQVCGPDGRVIRAEWQEGGTFPEDLVGEGRPVVPTWWTRELPSDVQRPPPPPPPKRDRSGGDGTRVAVFAAGGGGTVGQSLDQPGDFLREQSLAGGAGSVGALGRAPLSDTVQLFADGRATLPGAIGASETWAGLGFATGPVHWLAGGGFTTSPVFEGADRRRVVVGNPLLGAELGLPLGPLALDARLAGGWLPGAAHARVGADLRSRGAVGWMAGLEGGFLRTGFEQTQTQRTLAVAGAWGGARVGVTFGG